MAGWNHFFVRELTNAAGAAPHKAVLLQRQRGRTGGRITSCESWADAHRAATGASSTLPATSATAMVLMRA